MCICVYTFPMKWKMCSMMIDIKSITKQTTATAQVGVSVKLLPPPSPAMLNFN